MLYRRKIMYKSRLVTEIGRAEHAMGGIRFVIIASLILSAMSGYVVFNKVTCRGFSPVQRLYYSQFRTAFIKDAVSITKFGTYAVITRSVTDLKTKKAKILFCREHELSARSDAAGNVRFDSAGIPLVALKNSVPVDKKGFTFEERELEHNWIYRRFADQIFGREFYELFYPAIFVALIVFATVAGGLKAVSSRKLAQKIAGRLLRGTRLLTPAEYARKMKSAGGIGIVVRPREEE